MFIKFIKKILVYKLDMVMKMKRINIIIGHYGSGKTEFSINYIIKLSQKYSKVAIADLDIVNPYFRSREKKDLLLRKNISIVDSNKGFSSADLPALSPEILSLFQNDKYQKVVMDVGGDSVGVRVISRYNNYVNKEDYNMWMVVNVNRPQTQTVEDIIQYINSMEESSRLKITGLINNTHLLKETTKYDLLRGNDILKEVSRLTKLPIVYTSVIEKICNEIVGKVEGEILPIKVYMRPTWL